MVENTAHRVGGVVVQAGTISGPITVASPRWSPPVPRQLPPPTARFTNRRGELEQLHHLRAGGARLLVLVGIGGVGKSSVAAEFAHTVAAHYPDGQIHLTLGCGSGRPVPTGDLVASVLWALGVAAEHVPPGVADRIALARSLTHGRRLLVLADDAVAPEQIRPLIPTAAGSLLVVTARGHLTPLVEVGAHFVRVDPLTPSGAAQLLARLLPDSVPSSALAPVAAACAGMPLAVCAVAGLYALNPHHSLDATLSLLTRPPRSGSHEEVSMHAGLDATHHALPEPFHSWYPLLGLHPGTRHTSASAAALTGASAEETRDLLHTLTAASLLAPTGADTWHMHDVVRAHAAALARDLPPGEVDAALDRLLDHYLTTAAGADLVVNPHRWRLATDLYARAHETARAFADRAEALAWWQTHGDTVRALTRLGSETGRHVQTWQLAETCKGWFATLRPYTAWADITRCAVASARIIDDRSAEAFVLLLEAGRCMSGHDFADAEEAAATSLAIWREQNDPQGIGSALELVALATTALGHPHQAIALHEEAITCHERLGRPRGVALQRRFLAQTLAAAGQYERARALFTEALEALAAHGDSYQVVQGLTWQVPTLLALGDVDAAAASASEALGTARTLGNQFQTAKALRALASVEAARGRPDQERRHLTDAHQIFTALHAPEAAHTAAQLHNHTTTPDNDPKSEK